jgi:hypothetical protein
VATSNVSLDVTLGIFPKVEVGMLAEEGAGVAASRR